MSETVTPKRTAVIKVRVTPEERAFLEELSRAADRSVSSLIRVAIHNYYIKGAA